MLTVCFLLQLSYLMHTSIQMYRKAVWETSIYVVEREVRQGCIKLNSLGAHSPFQTGRFHVAIAIEFWDHVVAFLSLDNVFQVSITLYPCTGVCWLLFSKPEWAFGVGYLPATQEFRFLDPPPSIFANFTTFLECVAHWVEEQSSSTHSGLACKAVHGANHVWLGVGVYTVAELFFMAGKYCDPVNGPCTGIFLMLLMTGLSHSL